jgi:glycosyltransferase involved in cell wall biosynthesis
MHDMTSAGLISVVVPTFNRAYCLATALESVFAQTYPNLEVLLVDDGSTDGTRELVQERWAHEPRLRYLHQENRGVSAARNLGMRNARGAYIALLDSDDAWMPWKLEVQLACLEHYPDAGMVWTDMQAVDPAGLVVDPLHLRSMYAAYKWFAPGQLFSESCRLDRVMTRVPDSLKSASVHYGEVFSQMIMGNLVHTSTVLLRRSRFEHVRAFNESMMTGEDYDFHLRTCRAGPVAFLDAASIRYQTGRADRLTRPELSVQIGRNFLRTIEPVIRADRQRIKLPEWMLKRSLAEGHEWVGEAAMSMGLQAEARKHLAAGMRLHPQWRTAALFVAALLPPAGANLLRSTLRRIKGSRPGGAPP